MPTDNCKISEGALFVISADDGKVTEIGKVSEIKSIEPEEDIGTSDYNVPKIFSNEPMEATFTLDLPDGFNYKALFLLLYGVPIEKFLCNNWRKMHKLPMKRRRYASRHKHTPFFIKEWFK